MRLKTIAVLIMSVLFLLSGCGGGGGGGGDDVPLVSYSCALPCLKSPPTITPSTAKAGDTVTVQFEIEGNPADLTGIMVSLDAKTLPKYAGDKYTTTITSPMSVDFVIPAGQAPGEYFPFVRLMNDTYWGEYNLDERVSAGQYTYAQVVNATNADTYARSPIAIPTLTITP